MNRYITIETYAGEVTAFTEQDDYQTALRHDDVAAWVWQFAPDAETAVKQHYTKHDEWDADMQAGRDTKRTY